MVDAHNGEDYCCSYKCYQRERHKQCGRVLRAGVCRHSHFLIHLRNRAGITYRHLHKLPATAVAASAECASDAIGFIRIDFDIYCVAGDFHHSPAM